MIDQISIAFERQDYKTAGTLLKQLQQQSPDHPWLKVYVGKLKEVSGKPAEAEAIYRRVLQETLNPKIALQARQGLERLVAIAKEQQQKATETAAENHPELGVLVVEPVTGAAREQAIPNFARIMQLEAYTARLNLPSRGWKLYRTGAIGELQYLAHALNQAEIPTRCLAISDLQKIRVFRVQYLQTIDPQPTIVCQNEANQVGNLTFDWAEVKQQVMGALPILESVVDRNSRQKMIRKIQTQDYAQVLDLHLMKRNCILRFCDRTYDFQTGVLFEDETLHSTSQVTTRMRWDHLTHYLQSQLPQTAIWQGFTAFGETAIEQVHLLEDLPAHLDFFQRVPSLWNPAFHLYSGLIFKSERRGLST